MGGRSRGRVSIVLELLSPDKDMLKLSKGPYLHGQMRDSFPRPLGFAYVEVDLFLFLFFKDFL